MGQAYKIDRINLITYKGQKKKNVHALRCRYIAKSHIVNCSARSQVFEFVNFRGACFKKVDFSNAVFYGCDFWGTTFNNCTFKNTLFKDCVIMASRFNDCQCTGVTFPYTVIVNTNLSSCRGIDIPDGAVQHKSYPSFIRDAQLVSALETLSENRSLRKNKILLISDKKYNELNIYLLQKRFRDDELPLLLVALGKQSTSSITTYKKLERTLNKIRKSDRIK